MAQVVEIIPHGRQWYVFAWLQIPWQFKGPLHNILMLWPLELLGYLFMATTEDVWIIPSFWIWDYVLHVEHISRVITNCGQHQWVIPSPLSIALKALLEENTTRKLLSLSLDLFFKILLFQVAFLIFFSIAIFSPYFLSVGLLLQSVALFQSRKLVWVPSLFFFFL